MVLGSKVTMVAVTTLWKVSATTSKVARSHPGASARELLARATAPWALIVKLPEESIFIQFTPYEDMEYVGGVQFIYECTSEQTRKH